MAEISKIEWTDSTWNFVTGCDKVSSGCKNCYAETMAEKLQDEGSKRYVNGFKLTLHPEVLNLPFKWNKPRKVFVNSMSDLYHKDVPLDFIKRAFDVMNQTPQHTYQILTKRSERLKEIDDNVVWTPNIWQGVSVEDSNVLHRIVDLQSIKSAVRFLSCEPLIGSLFDAPNTVEWHLINWVIVGGESGPNARPMDEVWVQQIQKLCQDSVIPFFFKQWGGVDKKSTGRLLNGRTYDEMPQIDHT